MIVSKYVLLFPYFLSMISEKNTVNKYLDKSTTT